MIYVVSMMILNSVLASSKLGARLVSLRQNYVHIKMLSRRHNFFPELLREINFLNCTLL